MSESLSTLLKKEQPWANCSHRSLKKSDLSDSLVIQAKLPVFTAFPPFYTQELIAPVALPPIALFREWWERFALITNYKRATISEILPSFITKEQPWAIHSRHSLQSATGGIRYFSRANQTFSLSLDKKRVIRLKNRIANSRLCLKETVSRPSGPWLTCLIVI